MAWPFWKLEDMDRTLFLLFNLLESGFWNSSHLSNWCDEAFINLKEVPRWVVDLSFSKSERDAIKIILDEMKKYPVSLMEGHDQLLIGFYILMFERGDFDKEVLQAKSFDVADAHDSSFFVDLQESKIFENQKMYLYFKDQASQGLLYLNNWYAKLVKGCL